MNKTFRTILSALWGTVLLGACNIINPTEVTPTYVHIDSFTFKRNPNLPSSLTMSHQINSVWVYFNNNPIGVFDLPVTLPVLASAEGKISVAPGVSVAGLNSFLVRYPFYTGDTITLKPDPGKVVNIQPKTSFYNAVRNYPAGGLNFENLITGFDQVDGSVAITIASDTGEVFEGDYSGLIQMNRPNDTLSESKWNTDFSVPLNADAYIELNYKCDVPFYIGLQANMSGSGVVFKRYLAGVNASDHWQKFYLAIKDFVAQYNADNYTLFIKSYLPDDKTTGKVLLDNIQVIYFDH